MPFMTYTVEGPSAVTSLIDMTYTDDDIAAPAVALSGSTKGHWDAYVKTTPTFTIYAKTVFGSTITTAGHYHDFTVYVADPACDSVLLTYPSSTDTGSHYFTYAGDAAADSFTVPTPVPSPAGCPFSMVYTAAAGNGPLDAATVVFDAADINDIQVRFQSPATADMGSASTTALIGYYTLEFTGVT
jgi:hypothetical protein